MEETWKRAILKGSRPRVLLLCNPVNPTGIIYSEETLNMCIDFAESKKMHIICDEIYGNSIFPDEKLTSIAKLMHKRNPNTKRYMGDYVHVIAGFSKDFCVSGMRCGTLFTHNKDIIYAVESIGLFGAVSN